MSRCFGNNMAASLAHIRSASKPAFRSITDHTTKYTKALFRCFSQNSDGNSSSPTENKSVEHTSKPASPTEGALDKFAKVVDKVKKAQDVEASSEISNLATPEDPNETFASMVRRSKFVSLGEHKGRLVQGEIIEVMEDDLYIDFGGKFHCVCPRPKRNGHRYHRGSKVLLSLQCMEMSSAFLGSDIHVTLLEADATLLGLAASQRNKSQPQRN
ncbi:hypothetical protein EGW08_004913 [Elysia chlorotica]|uniref:Uncharacterized protein n=1 Tax=Elysia chlorotica TaxID=188477 RepID=A0A433U0C9_ELYCH|nr:hypothetical protein EGW08_004913 [Elysia chlorotica]